MPNPLTTNYISFAVFLLGALALVVPSGYSVGSGLLLLGSVVLLWRRPTLNLQAEDKLIMAVLAGYSLIFIVQLLIDGASSRYMDKPSRFLLALPVLLFVLAYPPKLSSLWSGLVVGSMLTGGWAIWQKIFEGVSRAGGHTNTIQFGNISMLLGLFCLAGLGWAIVQPKSKHWFVFLLLGALFGALGSLLSGSRGGWVGLPFVFFVLYHAYGSLLTLKIKLGIITFLLVFISTVYFVPEIGVQKRIVDVFHDIELYVSGENKNTSVGLRLDMWQGAVKLIAEKPLTGWGRQGYQEKMQTLADRGEVTQFAAEHHAHNEYLNNYARRGLLGIVSLLVLYLVPLRLFTKRLTSSNMELRAVATAGAILPVAFMDFGLTQTFLSHNSGVMIYAFWLVILWGSVRAIENKLILSKV